MKKKIAIWILIMIMWVSACGNKSAPSIESVQTEKIEESTETASKQTVVSEGETVSSTTANKIPDLKEGDITNQLFFPNNPEVKTPPIMTFTSSTELEFVKNDPNAFTPKTEWRNPDYPFEIYRLHTVYENNYQDMLTTRAESTDDSQLQWYLAPEGYYYRASKGAASNIYSFDIECVNGAKVRISCFYDSTEMEKLGMEKEEIYKTKVIFYETYLQLIEDFLKSGNTTVTERSEDVTIDKKTNPRIVFPYDINN